MALRSSKMNLASLVLFFSGFVGCSEPALVVRPEPRSDVVVNTVSGSNEVYVARRGDYYTLDGVCGNSFDPLPNETRSAEELARVINEYIDSTSLRERRYAALGDGPMPRVVHMWVYGVLPNQGEVDRLVMGVSGDDSRDVVARSNNVIPESDVFVVPERAVLQEQVERDVFESHSYRELPNSNEQNELRPIGPSRISPPDFDEHGHTLSRYRLGGPIRDSGWQQRWADVRRIVLPSDLAVMAAERELMSRMSAEKRIYLHEIPYLIDAEFAFNLVNGALQNAVNGDCGVLENLAGMGRGLPTVFNLNPDMQYKPVTGAVLERLFGAISGADVSVDIDRPDTGLGVELVINCARGSIVNQVGVVVQKPGRIVGVRIFDSNTEVSLGE